MADLDLEQLSLAHQLLELLLVGGLLGIRDPRFWPGFTRGHRSERGPEHLLFQPVVMAPIHAELLCGLARAHLAQLDLHHDLDPLPVGGGFPLSPSPHESALLLDLVPYDSVAAAAAAFRCGLSGAGGVETAFRGLPGPLFGPIASFRVTRIRL